nr:PREDICTED: uncharacterized protein LOC102689433 [Lepisosteus oculatus]XP_015222121.1 PREDICTED: uncharacterized protein LOC102689433 [Lepisosteus oculatus]
MLPQTARTESGDGAVQARSRVTVELRHRMGERTESRLQDLGLRCAAEVTITEHYYDNQDFQLAAQQVWLSKQDGKWRLILGSQADQRGSQGGQEGSEHRRDHSADRTETSKVNNPQETGGKGTGIPEELGGTSSFPPKGCSRALREQHKIKSPSPSSDLQPAAVNPASSSSHHRDSEPGPHYCELTADKQVIEHLAGSLQIALTEEQRRHLTVEKFLELAHIQQYGSHTAAGRRRYELRDTCTLTVETDNTCRPARRTAVLSMPADVLDIGRELEKMEKMAAELELEPEPHLSSPKPSVPSTPTGPPPCVVSSL